jgi:hypothetical protein
MRSQKRGGPPALPPDDAAVTYSRIEDAEELPPLGEEPAAERFADSERREPTFTAVRVDPPKRRRERAARVELDDFDDEPIALDPEALGAAASPRRPRRHRGSPVLRLVLLVGALAVIGGVGVLGATVVKVLYGGQASVAATPSPDSPAAASVADPTAAPATTTTSVLPDSGSAGPGVLAIPASDGGPIDMTPAAPANPQAALSPIPEAAPPPAAPAPKASASGDAPPPLPKPAPAAAAAAAPASSPSTDADIDSALSDVDRLLAQQKAQAAAAPQTLAPANQAVPAQPLPTDQSAALTITPPIATEPPPLPAPNTTIDPSIPVPPADIPNPGN